MNILTRSMSGFCLVCSPDEQNPSSTPWPFEQINPEQQSESDTQTNPSKRKGKEDTCCRLDVKVAYTRNGSLSRDVLIFLMLQITTSFDCLQN